MVKDDGITHEKNQLSRVISEDISSKEGTPSEFHIPTSSPIPTIIQSDDIDVPLEWLYKGKKAKKKHSDNKPHPPPTADSTSTNESHQDEFKQDESRLSSNEILKTPLATASEEVASPTLNTPKRNRSASINTASTTRRPTLVTPISTTDLTPPTSSSSNTNSLKRSSSLTEKSKKSLFSSLFGRRSSSNSGSQRPLLQNPMGKNALSGSAVENTPPQTPTRSRSPSTSRLVNEHENEPSSPKLPPVTDLDSVNERIILNKNPLKKPSLPIEELSKLNLKRVRFAVNNFESDPPQQLPSRKPKPGNVLIPDDMISEPPAISMGITNTSGNITMKYVPIFTKDSKEYKLALERHKLALKEAQKHQEEAHYAAERIAYEVNKFSKKPNILTTTEPIYENFEAFTKKKAAIDKPIHLNEHPFEELNQTSSNSTTATTTNNNYTSLTSPKYKEITLDIIYTRCCHLREILPIPSTLRQVKGKTAPLQTLKFLNPKPTLIDILSFCDFISIVPIYNIIFDNVTLSPLMFKILICSVVNTTVLEKLGLRNVVIDEYGWKLLCKFLMRNNSIIKLDISQTRTRSDLPKSSYRDSMDWNLFCQVLKLRRGNPLQELLLNGIKFHKLSVEIFENVLVAFATNSNINQKLKPYNPLRLGVATSDISATHIKSLLNWASEYNVQGMDLAFNDLSTLVKPIVNKLSSLDFSNLQYFTLNSTNILNSYDAALVLKYLSKLPDLKFLDLSNLPQIFPEIFPYLHKYLPRFTTLKRIHFDNNSLRHRDISMLCNILVKCRTLSQVSMLGQNLSLSVEEENELAVNTDNSGGSNYNSEFARNTLSVTLYTFVRDSPNLVSLDLDYHEISDEIQQRIGICLMRHMDKKMDSSFKIDELATQDDLLYDGSLMTETAETIMTRVTQNSQKNPNQLNKQDSTKRYLFRKYVENLFKVHNNVHQTIDNLYEKQKNIELSNQERDNLTRLILLEKNLHNILDIFTGVPTFTSILGQSLPLLKHVDSQSTILADNDKDSNSSPMTLAETENLSRPHLMATDSGRIIDVFTGKSLNDMSDTSTSHNDKTNNIYKKYQQEEGELHKWGFFVQQRHSIYPDNLDINGLKDHHNHSQTNNNLSSKSSTPSVDSNDNAVSKKHQYTSLNNNNNINPTISNGSSTDSGTENSITNGGDTANSVKQKPNPFVNITNASLFHKSDHNQKKSEHEMVVNTTTDPQQHHHHRHHHNHQHNNLTSSKDHISRLSVQRPQLHASRSGDELRNAIIKAKGVDSIENLIHSVNENEAELETIYGRPIKSLHEDEMTRRDNLSKG
ncbi:hypothetical protein TBLA_0B04010 [Henningerozyma blattae CBS 6284]|uniref:GLC7-interacting protein 3 n=1 Tax=Henningerozyma blattae (strain ATCC 34711 / CBS 6284 / DSM 70876 / NBRC 10599 / NRRL Y-10934 / UCD 77-7) TaxID=1071380 RepID=I2GYN7_HENB6|nr:hypothetical protein TBLA_0B04010 [Tetrapisispora blattae CBS 6284]CCH59239.1 hypothetical protein TBLA_0B04010 [Tetrapisispora blattae CBS 6284]